MTKQTIQTDKQPHFTIIRGRGELDVRVGENHIAILDGTRDEPIVDGSSYLIEGFEERLSLQLPADALVSIRDHQGRIEVHGIAGLVVETAFGDITIADVSERVVVQDMTGDLQVRDCAALVVKDVPRPNYGERRGVENVTLSRVSIVEVENIRRDLSLVSAQQATFANIGGSCHIAEVADSLEVAAVGGQCSIEHVGGRLRVGHIGGSATFSSVGAVERIGNVGGNLQLSSAQLHVPAPGSSLHIAVGGSARIELPQSADVAIHAIVGGMISGTGLNRSGPGVRRVVYGEGRSQLHLVAGGNIELSGGTPGGDNGRQSAVGSWR